MSTQDPDQGPSPLQEIPLDECSHNSKEDDMGLNGDASSESEVMFSVGSTPAGTPIKVPKGQTLTQDECDLLIQMESQNEYLTLKESSEARIHELEKTNEELGDQIKGLEKQLETTRDDFEKTVMEIKKSFSSKLENSMKQADSAKRDLESMVIKYAMSEKQIIDARKGRDLAEQKVREVMKEKESLLTRIKALTTDKTSLTGALDRKITDHATAMKEIEKLTNEIKAKDITLKQTQQKLQISIDSHSEVKEQVHNLTSVMEVLQKELEDCKMKTNQVIEHEQQINDESERLVTLEQQLTAAHNVENSLKQEIEKLNDIHSREIHEIKSQLSLQEEKAMTWSKDKKELEARVTQLLSQIHELTTELDTYRHREEEINDLSERLKDRVYLSQTEASSLKEERDNLTLKVQHLEADLLNSKQIIKSLENNVATLNTESTATIEKLKSDLEEKMNVSKSLRSKVDELENDKKIMSKKHANAMKEINRELTILRKKKNSSHDSGGSKGVQDTISTTSRTSSSSSLDVMSNQVNSSSQATDNNSSTRDVKSDEGSSRTSPGEGVLASLTDLSKESLLERLLRLQKQLAKRSERIDFLEDHNHQLVEELKKKTRLIQYYLLREESGALTTSEMDSNKREMVRKGATTMSTLYQYRNVTEADMTLELSLEINRKLQAVLEDTILKNMMLKESLSTLGEEVARLSRASMSTTCQ